MRNNFCFPFCTSYNIAIDEYINRAKDEYINRAKDEYIDTYIKRERNK